MNFLNRWLERGTGNGGAWVEVNELATLLKTASPPLVVDVRGPDEFLGSLGHIDGAENIPLDQLPTQMAKLLGKKRRLVMVCHTDRRSSAAAEQLRRAGGTDVTVLRGGMVAWRSMA